MAPSEELSTADLQRLARAEAPELPEAVTTFLVQPEKPPEKPLPEGAIDFQGLKSLLWQAQSRHDAAGRRAGSHEAWQRFLAQKDVPLPPRFALADLLVALYERNTDASRAALFQLVSTADLQFGLWGGLKRIYKLAEQRHDAEMFGVLAWRFDVERHSARGREVSLGTLTYLRRRAWRYLRHLGAAVPELYPFFDELVGAQVPGLGDVAFTPAYYARYADALRERARRLGAPWTPVLVERALWAHVGGKKGKR